MPQLSSRSQRCTLCKYKKCSIKEPSSLTTTIICVILFLSEAFQSSRLFEVECLSDVNIVDPGSNKPIPFQQRALKSNQTTPTTGIMDRISNKMTKKPHRLMSRNEAPLSSSTDMDIVKIGELNTRNGVESMRHSYNVSQIPQARDTNLKKNISTTTASNNHLPSSSKDKQHQLRGAANILTRPNEALQTSPTTSTLNQSLAATDLSASDSRPLPSSSRFDENVEENSFYLEDQDHGDGFLNDDRSLASSSNLNERRANSGKDFRKIVSKGISGALEPVRLETLEEWRQRQRQRKAIKEKRTKLFENILATAIETHPDYGSKTSANKTSSKRPSNRRRPPAAKQPRIRDELNKAASAADIDPELLGDTGTVLQHLQGLAQVIDNPSATGSSAFWNAGSDSDQDQTSDGISSASDDARGSDAASSDEDATSNSNDDVSTATKFKAANNQSGERGPIMRHIKRIKQSISQRRKQLDHIKKMFNIELAVNAKDGSLIGKPVSSSSSSGSKAKRVPKSQNNEYLSSDSSSDSSSELSSDNLIDLESPQDESASSVVDSSDSSYEAPAFRAGKRTKLGGKQSGGGAKMQELKQYLTENPDILAAVMSELTTDSDTLTNNNYNPDSLRPSSSSYTRGDFDPETDSPPFERRRSRFPYSSNYTTFDRFRPHYEAYKFRPTSSSKVRQISRSSNSASGSSAETQLIESLRDRQLLNLARLESALADRQEATSKRSNIYTSSSNYSSSLSSSHPDSRDRRSDSPSYSWSSNSRGRRSSNPPSGNLQHHFLVVSQKPLEPILRESSLENQHQGNTNQSDSNSSSSQWTQYDGGHMRGGPPPAPGKGSPQGSGSKPTLNRFSGWRDVSNTELGPSSLATNRLHEQPVVFHTDHSSPSVGTQPTYMLPYGIASDQLRLQPSFSESKHYQAQGSQFASSRLESPTNKQSQYNATTPRINTNHQYPASSVSMQPPPPPPHPMMSPHDYNSMLAGQAAFNQLFAPRGLIHPISRAGPLQIAGWPLLPAGAEFMSRSSAAMATPTSWSGHNDLTTARGAPSQQAQANNNNTSNGNDFNSQPIMNLNMKKVVEATPSTSQRPAIVEDHNPIPRSESPNKAAMNKTQSRSSAAEQPRRSPMMRQSTSFATTVKPRMRPSEHVDWLEEETKTNDRKEHGENLPRIGSQIADYFHAYKNEMRAADEHQQQPDRGAQMGRPIDVKTHEKIQQQQMDNPHKPDASMLTIEGEELPKMDRDYTDTVMSNIANNNNGLTGGEVKSRPQSQAEPQTTNYPSQESQPSDDSSRQPDFGAMWAS